MAHYNIELANYDLDGYVPEGWEDYYDDRAWPNGDPPRISDEALSPNRWLHPGDLVDDDYLPSWVRGDDDDYYDDGYYGA